MRKTGFEFFATLVVALLIKIAFFSSCDDIKEPKYNVDPELEQYLTSFVAIAELKGIDLSYIYEQDIYIGFTDNEKDQRVATAYKRNKDGIAIVVHRERFKQRTEQGRKYVMWHEFGHDILDLEHLEEGMMRPTAFTGFFKPGRFSDERQDSYLYKSLNGMFDIYLTRKNNNNESED